MNRRIVTLASVVLLLGVVVMASDVLVERMSAGSGGLRAATLGDARVLAVAYDRWKTGLARDGDARHLVLALTYVKGLSTAFTVGRGFARFDLMKGTLAVEASGLPESDSYDVWLIDNTPGPGHTVLPEAGDSMKRVGTLIRHGATASLDARLEPAALEDFYVDLVVVTPSGQSPATARWLVGSPSLFQRLYYQEARGGGKRLDVQEETQESVWAAPLRTLVPAAAYAKKPGPPDDQSLEQLIARGEDLFFNETFNGNGRTCATCHPADNNFTIDPAFIATLPPRDPLFVAEFMDALNFDKNGGLRFEDPELMRTYGLIVENVDGFGDLAHRFTMRGVPHTLGMSFSLTPSGADGTSTPPVHRTGWSGDGAPNDGSLRQFAVGAVTQHFPLTLSRTPGVDFRLPTDDELDAMEAFQLSLGRQEELNLATLLLRGERPARGKELFMTEAKCNTCHGNAGANLPDEPVNSNFDTGVEFVPDHPARLVKSYPSDGGFGTNPAGGFDSVVPNPGDGSFGNRTFNVVSLVEAADTGPFFHNNALATLEGAIDFYDSETFNETEIGQSLGGIELSPTDVEAVAAFLRVINALENNRSSLELNQRALGLLGTGRPVSITPLLRRSRAEIEDAREVLAAVGLHPDAVVRLKIAEQLIVSASTTASRPKQEELIQRAIGEQYAVRALMVHDG